MKYLLLVFLIGCFGDTPSEKHHVEILQEELRLCQMANAQLETVLRLVKEKTIHISCKEEI